MGFKKDVKRMEFSFFYKFPLEETAFKKFQRKIAVMKTVEKFLFQWVKLK